MFRIKEAAHKPTSRNFLSFDWLSAQSRPKRPSKLFKRVKRLFVKQIVGDIVWQWKRFKPYIFLYAAHCQEIWLNSIRGRCEGKGGRWCKSKWKGSEKPAKLLHSLRRIVFDSIYRLVVVFSICNSFSFPHSIFSCLPKHIYSFCLAKDEVEKKRNHKQNKRTKNKKTSNKKKSSPASEKHKTFHIHWEIFFVFFCLSFFFFFSLFSSVCLCSRQISFSVCVCVCVKSVRFFNLMKIFHFADWHFVSLAAIALYLPPMPQLAVVWALLAVQNVQSWATLSE